MAGMMEMRQQQTQPVEPERPSLEDDASNVAPEDQRIYDQFVMNGLKMIGIADRKIHPAVEESLKAGNDPVSALAMTTVGVVSSLEASALKGGMQIPNDIFYASSVELLEHLADVSEAATGHDFSEDDLGKALLQAEELYRVANPTGRVDQDAAKQDMAHIEQANNDGSLERMTSGIGGGQQQEAA